MDYLDLRDSDEALRALLELDKLNDYQPALSVRPLTVTINPPPVQRPRFRRLPPQYLLKLEFPFTEPWSVAAAIDLPYLPEVVTGSGSTGTARFVILSKSDIEKLEVWNEVFWPENPIVKMRLMGIAHKEPALPMLGRDPTLPQHRPNTVGHRYPDPPEDDVSEDDPSEDDRSEDDLSEDDKWEDDDWEDNLSKYNLSEHDLSEYYLSKYDLPEDDIPEDPRDIPEFPVYYFFYGTLGEPTRLARLFHRAIECITQELSPATLLDGRLRTWAHKYRALVDSPDMMVLAFSPILARSSSLCVTPSLSRWISARKQSSVACARSLLVPA